jgi:lysozyme
MIKGVDISHHNGVVDFKKLKSQGNAFAIHKATEGVGNTDFMFQKNREAIKAAGLIFGTYQFFHPDQDIDRQVKHYAEVTGPWQAGELPPVLDFESSAKGVLSRGQVKANALAFMKELESIDGIKPMLYISPGFAADLGDMSDFKDYILWIAHYGVNHPRIPRPWDGWTFWQYTDKNGMDLDLFNGELDALKALAKSGALAA